MLPVVILLVLAVLPFIAAFGLASVLSVVAAIVAMQPKAAPVRPDLDDLAAKVVRTAAQNRGYNSPTLAVVPVVGRVNAWHVVRKGQHERIVTAWNLAMLHTLVLGHLVACHQ